MTTILCGIRGFIVWTRYAGLEAGLRYLRGYFS